MTVIVCTAENLHPYECGDGCRHCDGTKDDTHDPVQCVTCCHWDDDEWQRQEAADPGNLVLRAADQFNAKDTK